MKGTLNFYLDDSGTRTPNRKPLLFDSGKNEFFALGGVLINEEDEGRVRAAYQELCARWSIDYPLHSVEIRHCSQAFSWLKRETDEYQRFMKDLSRFLTSIAVAGLACVVDRPGYDARYREKYGRRQWHLCQTAFSIVVERAAKFALANGRKLRVMPERGCPADERRIRQYFGELRQSGTPFNSQTSSLYSPLGPEKFRDTLYELRFKRKSSPMAQIADLYLWPIAIAGYDRGNRAYNLLKSAGRLIESHISETQWDERATKYSCFELVRRHERGL